MENLETRWLLAGNCTADFDGEKLEVKCDDVANQLTVRANGAGNLLTIGQSGTTINGVGGTNNLGSAANLTDVVIETNGGNDVVRVRDLSATASIEIKTGGGADRVIGRRLNVGNDLKVDTEDGNDRVNFRDTIVVGNSFEVKTGVGNDRVVVNDVTAGKDLKIETNEGNDRVTALNLSAGSKVLLDGGSGNDILRRDLDSIFGSLEEKEFETIIEL
jgi:hypothetical protein